jgi:uncharacterized protein YdeI (BOF family)
MRNSNTFSTARRIPTYASLLALGAALPLAALAQQPSQDRPQTQQPASQQERSGAAKNGDRSGETSQQAQASNKAGQQGQEKKSVGPNPYAKPDDSWISLSGTVNAVNRDSFTLDYGERTITVEMDDADRQAETYALRMGDKVTVNGLIDDDFFETSKIEASSVYVEKLGRHFFASALDEEDFSTVTYLAPIDGGIAVHGLVTQVGGGEFTIDNGVRSVRVDVGDMAYDPLDDDGYQKVEVGDIVRVEGRMDDDFWESRELMANSILTLVEEIG